MHPKFLSRRIKKVEVGTLFYTKRMLIWYHIKSSSNLRYYYIENNLIMIFNLSTKNPRRIGISKVWGQKGGHINFSLNASSCWVLSMKIYETLHNVSFKDCVSKVTATFFLSQPVKSCWKQSKELTSFMVKQWSEKT